MNKMTLLRGAVVAAAVAGGASAWAKVDVNVGVTIREPGVYGRIEVGTSPPPPVYYPRPVVIAQPAVVVAQQVQPMYLYVPPGHAKKWRKHCHRYNACGQPVYFVQEGWVRDNYRRAHPEWQPRPVPVRPAVMVQGGHRHEQHGKQHGKGKGKKDD